MLSVESLDRFSLWASYMLSEEAIRSFKAIYFAEFGVELSDAEATELAINFLTMMDYVYRSVKRAWLDELPHYPVPKQKPKVLDAAWSFSAKMGDNKSDEIT